MKQSPYFQNVEHPTKFDQTWAVGEQVSLLVEKAILGGKFMSTAPDGRVVWLKSHKALAIGDKVSGQVTKVAKRSFELNVSELIVPSPDRQSPFCPHIERCGGCPWQALSEESQIEALTRDIGRMMTRSLDQEVRWVDPFIDHGERWRCTARLHSKKNHALGFFGPNGLFDLDHCPIFSETLNRQLQSVKSRLSPLLREGSAEIRLSAAEDSESGTISLSLFGMWTADTIEKIEYVLNTLLDTCESIHGITLEAHTPQLIERGTHTHHRSTHTQLKKGRDKRQRHHRQTRSAKHKSQRRLKSPLPIEVEAIHRSWGNTYNDLPSVAHPAQAFMQAHQRGNQALVDMVVAGADESQRILELYAGSGNFTIPLAQAKVSREILALEYDQRAVSALNMVAAERGLKVTAQALSIDQIPAGNFDHVILDPPRSGAANIIEALAHSEATYITYISCHPAALARDLEVLSTHGWSLDYARLFHLFPHSGHGEIYCRLSRV